MNNKAQKLKSLIESNGPKFFSVGFIKADGSPREITGHLRKVVGHDGVNTVAQYEKYITMVLAEKDKNGKEQFRNVNTETITHLNIGGMCIKIEA